jgi:hypothetical protein
MSRPCWHCDYRMSSWVVGFTRAWLNPSYAVVVTTFETLIVQRKQSGEHMVRKANSAHDVHMRWLQQIWKHEMMSPSVARPSDAPHSPPHAGYSGTSSECIKTTFRNRTFLERYLLVFSEISILVRVNQFLYECTRLRKSCYPWRNKPWW